jgi:hypothetical protein
LVAQRIGEALVLGSRRGKSLGIAESIESPSK